MILCEKATKQIFVNKYWFDRKSDNLHFLLKDMYLSTRCQTECLLKEKTKMREDPHQSETEADGVNWSFVSLKKFK